MPKINQKQIVLTSLQNKEKLTQEIAQEKYGVRRLAARIKEIKNDGHRVKSERKAVTDHRGVTRNIAIYSMESEDINP